MNIKYPFQTDNKGYTATADSERHIRDMIGQILFTAPGERVNNPTFGSGLMQLIFEPNSNELATTVQFLIQGALQKWLGDIILVSEVGVQNPDALLQVTISYTIRRTLENKVVVFEKKL